MAEADLASARCCVFASSGVEQGATPIQARNLRDDTLSQTTSTPRNGKERARTAQAFRRRTSQRLNTFNAQRSAGSSFFHQACAVLCPSASYPAASQDTNSNGVPRTPNACLQRCTLSTQAPRKRGQVPSFIAPPRSDLEPSCVQTETSLDRIEQQNSKTRCR